MTTPLRLPETRPSAPAVQPGKASGIAPAPGFGAKLRRPPVVSEYTGQAYDPTNPNRQTTADGKGDTGANNGFNQANIWQGYYGQILRGQAAQGTREGAATGSREASDQFFANRPTTPEFQAGARPETAPWMFDQSRPELEGDDAIADRYTRFAGLTGTGAAPETQDVAGGGAAFQQYSQGALARLSQVLQDRTRDLTDSAAGRGRLETGYFTQDYGGLQRQLAEEARADMLMKALDAASLDQDAATGNADRRLKAALDGRRGAESLLDFSAGRSDEANKWRQGNFEDDRNFSRDTYADDRDESDTDFESDREYGEDAFRYRRDATRGDFESDRDFLEERYRGDEELLDNEVNRNIDLWAGARDWRTLQQQQDAQKKGGFGKVLGGALGLAAGSVLPGIGNAVGAKIGAGLYK